MQFSTLAIVCLAATGANAASGFAQTCTRETMDGSVLTATCHTGEGESTRVSRLDLKDCFFFLNKQIECGAGGVGGCTFGNMRRKDKDFIGDLGPDVDITCPEPAGRTLVRVNLSESPVRYRATLTFHNKSN
ncbi:hypothetical protein PpBr36_02037 [Pyricularia pennisetigena]|uniref:hypothetical protein n=1 Tax=Pyricularia pennisetigena TaxID=1578925 RepID=UPI00114E848D|nr:hypothetical protein PpBr36_02037 [Pyricularia pennisetigena]TLS29147.1 hypothetical protein PpBr36_02037 [Pyricularia pennisetigena]